MDIRFPDILVREYIHGVLAKGTLEEELVRVQTMLIDYTKHPKPDKAFQNALIGRTNQLFRALLEARDSSAR